MIRVAALFTALAVASEPPVDASAPPDAEAGPPPDDASAPPEPEPASQDEPPAPEPEPAAPAPPPRHDDAAANAAASGGLGGYGDAFELRGRPPRDGEDEVLAGSIVLPLGILGAASSGVQLWLSMPGHCQERWGKIGKPPTEDQCKGVYAFSIVRVVHSSLMAVAGGVLLGIGLARRKKYRAWKRGEVSARLDWAPWISRSGAGVGLAVRFGARSR
jgi:hypothetical protein